MAPTLLQGWKISSFSQASPGSQPSTTASTPHDESPTAYPGRKAEQILGGADLDQITLKKKGQHKEKKILRKFSNFMTVSESHVGKETGRIEEVLPFLDTRVLQEPEKPQAHTLRRQGSSPLLGDVVGARSTSYDYFNFSGPRATKLEAPASPRSPVKQSLSPFVGGHNSSTASPMDHSVSRNHPKKAPQPPLQHNILGELRTSVEASMANVRNLSAESAGSGEFKAQGASRTMQNPRPRPSVTDPPTLYPDAPRAFHAVSPPPALINSSLPKPMRPADPASKSSERPKWWLRSKTDRQQLPKAFSTDISLDSDSTVRDSSSTKLNVRKPKAGMRNWFDGLDEDDMKVDPALPSEQSQTVHLSGGHLSTSSSYNTSFSSFPIEDSSIASDLGKAESSIGNYNSPDRKSSLKASTGRIQSGLSSNSGSLSRNYRPVSPTSKSMRSTASCKGTLAGIDLKMQSALNLSSSDDEDEGVSTISRESAVRRHRIRASVERADYGDDILVGNAQRVQPVKPRPIVNKAARRRSPRRSKSPDSVPPVPQLPLRPPTSSRGSSLRWREVIEEKSSTTDAGGDSTLESGSNGDTPLTTPISTRTSLSSHKKPPFRGSKLMKVTSEEERLLEAMREKRASIRANDGQKADPPITTPRPRTSGGLGGRSSFRRSSSLYDARYSTSTHSKKSSRTSISPIPILTNARYAPTSTSTNYNYSNLSGIRMNNRKSMSTDDLFLDYEDQAERDVDDGTVAFPFPPQALPGIVPTRISQQSKDVSPPRPSPGLSFGGSDAVPSTPSTANMPLTPPPFMPLPPVPGNVNGGEVGLARTLSTGSGGRFGRARKEKGHDRKRTVSSGVVMLDGVEVAAQEADEEREIIGWALESY